MMEIKKRITPFNYNKGVNKKNKYIVVHYVGSESSAKNNVYYFASKKLDSSAHYFVDEASIWQSVEDKDIAWHCGDKKNTNSNGGKLYDICKNSNSIGVEMCCFVGSDGKFKFKNGTIANTIKLIRELMKKHSISIDNVVRHYDVSGKLCPEPYVDETNWREFINMIKNNELITVNDIVWELANQGIISNKNLWLKKLEEDINVYWLARKCANKLSGRC